MCRDAMTAAAPAPRWVRTGSRFSSGHGTCEAFLMFLLLGGLLWGSRSRPGQPRRRRVLRWGHERWKQQFSDENAGTENAHRPLLIEGGDVSPFIVNNTDLRSTAASSA